MHTRTYVRMWILVYVQYVCDSAHYILHNLTVSVDIMSIVSICMFDSPLTATRTAAARFGAPESYSKLVLKHNSCD